MSGADTSDSFAGLFDAHLPVRPPLTDEQLKAIPAKRGVFFLVSDGERPVLLATAASVRARLRGRLDEPADSQEPTRSADLRAVTRKVYWKLAGGHFETDWRYLELARSIWPKGYGGMLAWRPAWFVRVDPAEPFPQFVRTREAPASPGRCVGPFPNGRAAERFIEIVQDFFGLCRDTQWLRRSPRGQRCTYGQMGRCLCPCDGTIPMEAYRQAVVEAAEFAAGRRDTYVRRLRTQMDEAAEALRFERAGAVKARLDRLAELDAPAYTYLAPIEAFRFLLIQPSGSRRKVKVFLVCRGAIAEADPLEVPLAARQLKAALKRMAKHVAAAAARPAEPADRWRIGLVARTLFSSPQRRGAALRWHEGLTPEELAAAVRTAAVALGVGPRRRAKADESAGTEPGSQEESQADGRS
jgi:DNA polymerase-3 subunit epsilon